MESPIKIAILLFENYTALDVVGPYEILSKVPNAKIYLTAIKPGLYRDLKELKINADYSLQDIPDPDILVIPGGFGIDALLNNQEIIHWIQKAHETTKFTISICSGALLLGAAGLLKNCKATTHWNRMDRLKEFDAIEVHERYVHDGKIITSAGVSAGIDMSLYLVSLLSGENVAKTIQLAIEYDPKPPFDSGAPNKVPKEILEFLRKSAKPGPK